MANRRRARIIPTDSWPELQPLLLFPDQEAYEVIRPIVLSGFTPLERSLRPAERVIVPAIRHVFVAKAGSPSILILVANSQNGPILSPRA